MAMAPFYFLPILVGFTAAQRLKSDPLVVAAIGALLVKPEMVGLSAAKSSGVGVERTFPLHSPRVDKIEVVRYGAVRRAKLYYLRALQGKAARIKERRRDV